MKTFGKWRSFFWPIHAFELKKVLPMFLMFFLISFNLNILRNTKDSLIVTAPGSGPETIIFVKFWLGFPCAVLFTLIYAKLSNILSKQALFYSVLIPFLLFFAFFALFLYPNREWLHPTEHAEALQAIMPEGLMGFVAIYRNWTFALFYILAELWGGFMLSLMFWGFANEITRVSEAKRFYALFGIGGNIALLFSGSATVLVSNIQKRLPDHVDPWGVSLKLLMGLLLIAGLGIMATYWWINRYVLTDPRLFEEVKKKNERPKLSLKESFAYLTKSPYLGFIAILVIAYGISINIVEVTWKSQLKLKFPNCSDYAKFMGYFSTTTGAVTALMMLFVGGNVIRKFGWKTAALVTPTVLLITGVAFFILILFRENLSGILTSLGTTSLMLSVIIGSIQNIMSKSCKYSLFDPTKEMAYIPLDQEQKVKGKAAIDVVGARLGKSGGSLMQQGLIIGFGSIAAITPYLTILLILVISVWIFAVKGLHKRFESLTHVSEEAAREAEKEAKISI